MNQTAAARAAGMDQLERIAESAVVATYYGMIDAALVARAHQARKQVGKRVDGERVRDGVTVKRAKGWQRLGPTCTRLG